MIAGTTAAFTLLLLATPGWAEPEDPCSAASTVPGVRFALALKGGRATFQAGETIPLALSFTATSRKSYWADRQSDDGRGPLWIETYCAAPEAPDPLASYLKARGFGTQWVSTDWELGAKPFTVDADLNEWRTLGPGHYRVYAISQRVWRPPDSSDQPPRIHETVRSNAVDLDVLPPDAGWQERELRGALEALDAAASPDDQRRASRRLRFLNTQESTRQLAKLFEGVNQPQASGLDLMFGLYASPYRKLAIDSMRDELAAPGRTITRDFMDVLVDLQVGADPAWDPPVGPTDPEALNQFWQRRRAHTDLLLKAEMERVVAALPRKVGSARALTLDGLLTAAGSDQAIVAAVRPALIAAWNDLPGETQRELIQYRWSLIAGPEMLPILRRLAAEPPPPARSNLSEARNAVLKHLHELDPAAGRESILRDALDPRAQPGLKVIALLPKEDIPAVVRPTVERIGRNAARELDYDLLDRYADAGALGVVRPVFESGVGKWGCDGQAAMLRYFLRVDPAYGAGQVRASMAARKDTRCYVSLLQRLGDELPKAQRSAIDALDDDDPDLVQDAVLALGRWGSADAKAALWTRLRRFHQEWAGREDQLRMEPDYRDSGSRGAALAQGLVSAIAESPNWLCPPDELSKLAELAADKGSRQRVESWMEQWKKGPALIRTDGYPEEHPTFGVLQYAGLTEDQLLTKVAQFPRGTQVLWQFRQPRQINPPVSLAVQEAVYERVRAAAGQNGVTLEKDTSP